MNVKTRLATVILSGLLLGLVAVKLERSALPIEKAVLSRDDAVRNQALERFQGIQNIGEKGRIVGELSTKGAKSPDPKVRIFALYALRKSGWKGPRVSGPIISGLTDPDPRVRDEAAVGLREIGTGVFPQILWSLGNPAVRNAARDVGHDLPPDSVKELERGLKTRGQQRAAAYLLSQISRPDTIDAARPLAPALAENLKSSDTVLSVNSAFALNVIDPKDPRPYPIFMKSIRAQNWDPWDVRGWDALEALSTAPAYKEKLADFLKEALTTAQDGWIRGRRFKRPAIGDALNKVAPLPGNLPALVLLLKSSSANARWRAVYAIGSPSDVDEQALAPLVGALDDKDPIVAGRAVWALDRLGLAKAQRAGDTVFAKVIATYQRVNAPLPGFWMSASHSIASLGLAAVPLTFDAVRARKLDPDKASAIVRTIAPDIDAAPALREALTDKNADVRVVAAMGLSKFAPETPGVEAELKANLETRKAGFRSDIQRTLDIMNRKRGGGPGAGAGAGPGPAKGKGKAKG
jgi:HEAT repeat protein